MQVVPEASVLTVPPACGVIEGFYGNPWSWDERCLYAEFLRQAGFSFYIYAPKSDSYLRKHWRENWPLAITQPLSRMANTYAAAGMEWGLGLSPLGLQEDWGARSRSELLSKLDQIKRLRPDIVCILFDDMRGDISGLAHLQAEIVNAVIEHNPAKRYIMCPSYYSHDPVLEELFGDRPLDYWSELGHSIPKEVGIFWTGNLVCSPSFSFAELDEMAALFCRPPTLWDNYPVNDGRVTSNYLNVYPYTDRPAEISRTIQAHVANPMNAAQLSMLPLLTLIDNYKQGKGYSPELSFKSAMERLHYSAPFKAALQSDWQVFQKQGLLNLDVAETRALKSKYQGFDDLAALEIVGWLDGKYTFDPDCLTS